MLISRFRRCHVTRFQSHSEVLTRSHGNSSAQMSLTMYAMSHSIMTPSNTVVFRSNRIVTCHGLKNIRNISYVNVSQGTKSSADQAGAADAIKIAILSDV